MKLDTDELMSYLGLVKNKQALLDTGAMLLELGRSKAGDLIDQLAKMKEDSDLLDYLEKCWKQEGVCPINVLLRRGRDNTFYCNRAGYDAQFSDLRSAIRRDMEGTAARRDMENTPK